VETKKIGFHGILVYMAAFFCFVFTMLFPEPMVNMSLPIPELMSTAVGFLQIYIFCIFAIGFLGLFSAIFQSFGAWKTAIAGAFAGKIFIMMPALLMLFLYCVGVLP